MPAWQHGDRTEEAGQGEERKQRARSVAAVELIGPQERRNWVPYGGLRRRRIG